MKFIDIFPTIIFGEKLNNISSIDLDNYKRECQSLTFNDLKEDGKSSYNQKVLEINIFNKLKINILNFSRIYLNNLGHIYEDIQISNSWVNILDKGEKIHSHLHTNSYISGVFYLDYSSPIYYLDPTVSNWFFKYSSHNNPVFKITPEPNLLLLFPSWLKHGVEKSNLDNRISIAFNIIPKGEFGEDTAKLYL